VGLVFQGATALSLDAKGRLAVPARYRDDLNAAGQGRLVLTAHPHGCLLLFPLPAWEPIRDQILKTPSFNAQSQPFKRVLVGNAREESLDAAGRLLIAPELRDTAQLEKTVWLVGLGTHFEIWSDAGWKRQFAMASDTSQSATDVPQGFEGISL
jgi:MraZ protein